jgi:hypothetical protein
MGHHHSKGVFIVDDGDDAAKCQALDAAELYDNLSEMLPRKVTAK